jgi:hypothetical protein
MARASGKASSVNRWAAWMSVSLIGGGVIVIRVILKPSPKELRIDVNDT